MSAPSQLFVGLGNPGKDYAGNRHNAGFMALDAIAEAEHAPAWQKKFHGLLTEITLSHEGENHRILLLKPQTYMNKSGLSVAEACRFYKILPESVSVFHDELDLPFGTLRLKRGGGHGGHNGLRDIDSHIGKPYRRLRIGIAHPGYKDAVTGYVLQDFSKEEQKSLTSLWQRICDIIPSMAMKTDAEIMNQLHSQN